MSLDLSDCLITPLNISPQINNPFITNLKGLKLYLFNIEIDLYNQNLLFQSISSLKCLEDLHLEIFEKKQINSDLIEQFAKDLG